MAEPVRRIWTLDEFFAWQENQPYRYELVDGHPLRMMAGAKNVHDDIVVNLVAELRDQVRGSGCRPFTGDGSVETRPGQIRRPDVGVDCGPRNPNATKASLPKVVIEVFSPSTRDLDTYDKLQEYKSVASIDYVLLVEPNEPFIYVWSRDDDGKWVEQRVRGLDKIIAMPKLKIELRMVSVFEGVQFPVVPRLVHDEGESSFTA